MERVRSKYPDWTRGQIEALFNIIGEENARKLLAGEISVNFEEVRRKLFDRNGRRIPRGLSVSVCDANWDFRLNQPKLETDDDFTDRIVRLYGSFGMNVGITTQQFKVETERLLALIRDNPQVANILNGVWFPVILPQLTISDLGTALEQYLEAVGKSYAITFRDWKFYNHRKGKLANEVSIVDGSRHDQLIERMRQGSVVGIHFPSPLQEFSIQASWEQMATLPKGFILSGMDTPIAMTMYPDVLARDWKTPCLQLSALSWQSTHSLYFKTYHFGQLDFGNTDDLVSANDYFGGLLFIG